jgi:hypothetical protein
MNLYIYVVYMVALNSRVVLWGGGEGGSVYGENVHRFTKATFATYRDTHKYKYCGSVFILTLHGNHNRWKVRMGVPSIWKQLAAV